MNTNYNYNPNEIEARFYDVKDGFAMRYKANGDFLVTESLYRTRLFEALQDVELMKHIRFCNDFLAMPPLLAYLKYCKKMNIELPRVDDEKARKNIGSWWGFVFRLGFGYQNAVNKSIELNDQGFSSASFFLE
jgi:hypothetical protein